MKKIFLFILTFPLISTYAQPVLNKLYDFNIGHVYSYRKVPANWNLDTTLIQTSGNNITWNFDTITLLPTVFSDSILSPTNAAGNFSFPDADYVWKEYSGTLQYYNKIADTVFYMGNYTFFPSTFTPNPKTAILPTNISNGYVYDNFSTNVAGNGVWTYNARYNAYGSLKLPGVTHSNVGLYITVGGTSNLKFADYLWFKENQTDPVMRIQFVWNNSGSTVQYLYVNTSALTPNAISNLNIDALSIMPNPSTNKIQINYTTDLKSFNIYNELGQSLQYQTLKSKNFSIDISALPKGMYFILLEDMEGRNGTKSFLKQ